MDVFSFFWTLIATALLLLAFPFRFGWTQIATGDPLHMRFGLCIIASVYGGIPVAGFQWWREHS